MTDFADNIESYTPSSKSPLNDIEWKIQPVMFDTQTAQQSWINFINTHSGGTANIVDFLTLQAYAENTPYIKINSLLDATDNNFPFNSRPVGPAYNFQYTANEDQIAVYDISGSYQTLSLRLHPNNALHELFSSTEYVRGHSGIKQYFRRRNFTAGSTNPTTSGSSAFTYFIGRLQTPAGYEAKDPITIEFNGKLVYADSDDDLLLKNIKL